LAWEAGRKPLGFWEGSGIPDAPPALCEFGGRDGRERYGEVGERWPNPRRILRAATGDGASASLCLFREEAVALVHSRSRAEASSTALLWPLGAGLLERWVCALRCGKAKQPDTETAAKVKVADRGGEPRCRLLRDQAGPLFSFSGFRRWSRAESRPQMIQYYDASSLDFGPKPRSTPSTSL